jgi:hypothetical protein
MAQSIIELLAKRHADDVWVTECNTGSAWRGCRRLDGWAMKKTWSPLTTIGYEIKVDRRDFLRDDKWPTYLDYCHQFYFVCPSKLIDKAEIPEGCGLIYAGARLLTKVKAPRREPPAEKMIELMIYVLMSRAQIVANMHRTGRRETVADYWAQWLKDKDRNSVLGRSVSRELRRRVLDAEGEAREARAETATLGLFREELIKRGLDPDNAASKWCVERQVDEVLGAMNGNLGRELEGDLRRSILNIQRTLEVVERIRKAAASGGETND